MILIPSYPCSRIPPGMVCTTITDAGNKALKCLEKENQK